MYGFLCVVGFHWAPHLLHLEHHVEGHQQSHVVGAQSDLKHRCGAWGAGGGGGCCQACAQAIRSHYLHYLHPCPLCPRPGTPYTPAPAHLSEEVPVGSRREVRQHVHLVIKDTYVVWKYVKKTVLEMGFMGIHMYTSS
jgi:hypothetical protein